MAEVKIMVFVSDTSGKDRCLCWVEKPYLMIPCEECEHTASYLRPNGMYLCRYCYGQLL